MHMHFCFVLPFEDDISLLYLQISKVLQKSLKPNIEYKLRKGIIKATAYFLLFDICGGKEYEKKEYMRSPADPQLFL